MCIKGKTLLPLKPSNRLCYTPCKIVDEKQHDRCYTEVCSFLIEDTPITVAYSGCSHNLLIGFHNRAASYVTFNGNPITLVPGAIQIFQRFLRYFGERLKVQTNHNKMEILSFDELLSKYLNRGKRERIKNGWNSFTTLGLTLKDLIISIFAKFEPYPYGEYVYNPTTRSFDFVEEPKDTRLIYACSDTYFTLTAMYIKLLEKQIYHTRGFKNDKTFPSDYMFAKGWNLDERGFRLNKYMGEFVHPVVINFDMSRFEKSVSWPILQSIIKFLSQFIRFTPLMTKDLFFQLFNANKSRRFRSFLRTIDGIPCLEGILSDILFSGDVTTSLIACIVMTILISSFVNKRFKYFLMVDGDDTTLICDRKNLALFDTVEPYMRNFGFKCKVENVAFDYHDVEWCQCKPMIFNNEMKFVRHFKRSFFKMFIGLKLFDNIVARNDYYFTLGHCELILHSGIPILQSMAQCAIRITNNAKFMYLDSRHPLFWYKQMLGDLISEARMAKTQNYVKTISD